MAFSAHLNRILFAALSPGAFLLSLSGCASPGAPKPPSLHLPAFPKDVAALRQGEDLEISFTAPSRTTDGLLLKESVLHGRACVRPTASAACATLPLSPAQSEVSIKPGTGKGLHVFWTFRLPVSLREGSIRAAAVEVELLNDSGSGAGWSTPTWFAAGAAPPPVAALEATGTRQGTLLRWKPVHDGGEVILRRAQVRISEISNSQEAAAEEVTLQADPGDRSASESLDPSLQAGVPVRYTAYRRVTAQIGGHNLEMRSEVSSPLLFTWRDVYPPPAPKRLRAVGFTEKSEPNASSGVFAVDLIWDPVDDERVTGYLVMRSTLHRQQDPLEQPVLLTQTAVVTPAFHDVTAKRGELYRYDVVAVDAAGNRSAAATTLFDAQ